MTRARMLLPALVAAALGCNVGTMASNFQPAQNARGIETEVSFAASSRATSVELLAVEDTALIAVLRPENARASLVILPLREIHEASCPAVGNTSFVRGGVYASPELRAKYNLMARYPQGISPELMKLLLEDYEQTAPAGIEGG